MRDLLPYLVIVVIVAIAFVVKQGWRLKLPAASAPAVATNAGETAAQLFARAQAVARQEAAELLDRKFAEDATNAAIAIYHAPFSPPPAPEDKPAA